MKPMRLPPIVAIACLLIVGSGLVLSGCRQSNATDKIRLQLNWLPDAQFGGYFAAILHGDYAAEGLDVELVPGGPGVSVIPKVVLGRVEFGIGNADQILLARQEEGKLVAVMAPMQNSPRCVMVHASSGFQSLLDVKDVTMAIEEGLVFAQYLRAHAPLTNVRLVAYAGSVARFVLEKNYAQQAYVFSEPLVARRQGSDPQSLMLSDIGFNPYAGTIFTSESYLEKHPEVVGKFVRATRRGWERYLAEPRAANEEIHRRNPEMDLASLEEAVSIIRELCLPKAGSLGHMSSDRWRTLAHQMTDLGILRIPTADVDRCYTLEFVE